jgi:hypothetical protein
LKGEMEAIFRFLLSTRCSATKIPSSLSDTRIHGLPL